MSFGNDTILSGHLGLNLTWSGDHPHHARRMNTVPMHRPGNWLDTYYSRGKVGAAKAKKKAAPAVDPLQSAANVSNAIQLANFPKKVQPFVMDQTAMETDGFTSPAFLQDNNASGISPDKTHPHGVSKWRYFPDINAWAVKMKEVISMNKGAGRPIDATTLKDYVHRLKVNGYFGKESEASYYNKVNAAGTRWRNIESLEEDTNQKIVMPKDRSGGMLAFFKAHPVITGVGAAVGGILVLKALVKR